MPKWGEGWSTRRKGKPATCRSCGRFTSGKPLDTCKFAQHGAYYMQAKLKEKARMYKISLVSAKSLVSRPCEICGNKGGYIDHNHKTGEARGGLCMRCNFLVGYIETSRELLPKVLKYLGLSL